MNDITIRRPIEWVCSSATDRGSVRSENEDAILDKRDIGLWLVADGMGGHEAGNVASQMIVESLENMTQHERLSDFINDFESRIIDVNQRLLEYSEIMLDGRLVGSTFVCFVIHKNVGICLWMGDSRLYVYRGRDLVQLSRDHSQVSELIRSGAITEDEAKSHPDVNVITRAVGTSEELYIDIDIFPVLLGDTFLLCSDGLYNAIDVQDIKEKLNIREPGGCVDGLIELALENGAADNVSVIVVKGTRKNISQVSVT